MKKNVQNGGGGYLPGHMKAYLTLNVLEIPYDGKGKYN